MRLRSSSETLKRDDAIFKTRARKAPPHEFVLDALAEVSPRTRSMFGCLAIYVGEKIVLFLRDKPSSTVDNGVWLATSEEHHQSLRAEFPAMRSIQVLGKKITGWQVLPADAADFEEAAMRACEMVIRGDERIGKIPNAKTRSNRKSQQNSPKKSRALK